MPDGIRVSKKPKTYSFDQFRKDYPDDKSCLDKLFQIKFGNLGACPSCAVVDAEFKRIVTRRCYQCTECGHQLYPTAGTVMHKSRTPLVFWFQAIFLYTTTRNGVAAKELQRQFNITYKTAWRMAGKIREAMVSTSTEMLTGDVIVDETFIGGKMVNKHRHKQRRGTGYKNKIPVFGMMDEKGRVITVVLDRDPAGEILKPIIRKYVDPTARIISDGFGAYNGLKNEFIDHQIVRHERAEFVNEAGFSTNAIETYWSSLKRTIRGTHINVSYKHLPKYIAENSFRSEHKGQPEKMFELILQMAA
jgi:transposase-like protein